MVLKKVELYTDGACKGNPGPGGWGVLLRYGKVEKVLSGAEPHTTNNRMELMAAIQGLKALKRPASVDLYTDSEYLRKGVTEWVQKWKNKNWKGSTGKPIKNQDLWQILLEVTAIHHIKWHWIKGHSGHPENERADELATSAITIMLEK